jgi:hypothetical protein
MDMASRIISFLGEISKFPVNYWMKQFIELNFVGGKPSGKHECGSRCRCNYGNRVGCFKSIAFGYLSRYIDMQIHWIKIKYN